MAEGVERDVLPLAGRAVVDLDDPIGQTLADNHDRREPINSACLNLAPRAVAPSVVEQHGHPCLIEVLGQPFAGGQQLGVITSRGGRLRGRRRAASTARAGRRWSPRSLRPRATPPML